MSSRRVVVAAFGGPEVLEIETRPVPVPGPGEALIRVLASGAAFTDVMIRKGLYPDIRDRPPFGLGYDMVGRIEALGPGAEGVAVGQMVADLTTLGANADHICRPADGLTQVPDGLDPVRAVAATLSGVTAWQMLHRVARLDRGQRLLIHGAGGAVGTAMLHLARDAGIAAVGVDRMAKHEAIAALGAVPVDADAPDLEEALAAAAPDGVDAAFDPLGGPSLARSLHVLRPGGMLVAFGFYDQVLGQGGHLSWDILRLTLWDLLPNGHATAFYSIGAMRRQHPAWFRADLAEVLDRVAKGRIDPPVGLVLPLDAVAQAHRLIEEGSVAGKIVLTPDGL
ncbi:oxidoreductase [Rhodobacteraceae bacterium CCMM004]|nr:oxidoreductase [Rhodobacteraceae bacterium CCMM004]